ncbi:hypothetical protein NQ317_012888 [Molorchus minor]|uniref:Uncharacterized protein n=1 Tax=Molorchus minor TaxID=1323400 RepID=A0ABQ9JR35_9CUCU|nr:hypothetical protein NQ317_012888 [Molorchus minor]
MSVCGEEGIEYWLRRHILSQFVLMGVKRRMSLILNGGRASNAEQIRKQNRVQKQIFDVPMLVWWALTIERRKSLLRGLPRYNSFVEICHKLCRSYKLLGHLLEIVNRPEYYELGLVVINIYPMIVIKSMLGNTRLISPSIFKMSHMLFKSS